MLKVTEELEKLNRTLQLESVLVRQKDWPLYLQHSVCQECGAQDGVECEEECRRWVS